MRKWLALIIVLMAAVPALAFGYIRLLDAFIADIALPVSAPAADKPADKSPNKTPAKSVVKQGEQISQEDEAAEETPAAQKKVVRLAPAKADEAPVFDGVISEILARSENIETEITVEIGDLSDDDIAEELLESGRYYGVNWMVSERLDGTFMAVTPVYKVAEEIFYARRTGDEANLSRKAKTAYDIARDVIAKNIKDGMSDYEKALAIHDYLVKSVRYDMAAANTVYDGKLIDDKDDSFTAFGPLFNKKGVCQAYSEAFNVLMRLLGIECMEVTGEAGGTPHAWNRIALGGEYYQIDATWDDPYPDKYGEVSRAYFCLTDDMLAADHIWERDDKACVSTKYNYFAYNNLVVKNQKDFDRIIGEAVKSDAPYVEMKLDGFDVENASLDYLANVTGLRTFSFSQAGEQPVIKVYLR